MSPQAHTLAHGPTPSRLALVVYGLCGVIGAAGLFAAARDFSDAPVEAPTVDSTFSDDGDSASDRDHAATPC